MTGGQMMVVLIVAIVMIAGIIKTKHASRSRQVSLADDPEAARLREEVKALRDRIAVLEQITVEKENSLERQIEQLRDR